MNSERMSHTEKTRADNNSLSYCSNKGNRNMKESLTILVVGFILILSALSLGTSNSFSEIFKVRYTASELKEINGQQYK